MAQTEALELVVTAVNRAAPVLQQVSHALDQVKLSTVELDASMRQSADALRHSGQSFRGVSEPMRDFTVRTRELSGGFGGLHVSTTKFASSIGGDVVRAITQVGGAVLAAAASVEAFTKKLIGAKQLNELARALGVPKELIKGLRRTGEEAGVPAEKIDQMLTDLLSKFQDMRFRDRGDFYAKLLQIPEARRVAGELASIFEDVDRGRLTDAEGQKQALLRVQKFFQEYTKAYGEASLRNVLGKAGLSEDWAIFGRIPVDEFAKRISGLAGSTNELDPEQVEKFWKAWREFSRVLGNFTTTVLTPLLPKLTEFIGNLTNNKELMDFVEKKWPQICSDIEVGYFALKAALEGNPIDWNKVLGTKSFKLLDKAFSDFFNQLKTRAKQFLAGIGLASQADVDAARKEELQFRKENFGGLSEAEEKELQDLEAGKRGAAGPTFLPKVSPEQEQAIIRRMEEYRQKQRFTDTGDEDSDRLTIENTRALKDLTEEINKLNMRFMRGLSPAGNEAVEGREYGGPVRGGQRYLVGEGHRPELFIPRQEGGPVQAIGKGGSQIFTPAQSGAVEPLLRPWRPGDPIRGIYGGGKKFPILSEAATPLPTQPGYPRNVMSGVSQGRGVASWYSRGTDPQGKFWGDPAAIDKPGSAALDKIPDPYTGSLIVEPGDAGPIPLRYRPQYWTNARPTADRCRPRC